MGDDVRAAVFSPSVFAFAVHDPAAAARKPAAM
jgi:hypothetical protein